MKASLQIEQCSIVVNLSQPLDISIPLQASEENPLAWYQGAPTIEPVQMGDWTGKVSAGASVNFNNILFNPHAHGTHTECFGHISEDFHSVNEALESGLRTRDLWRSQYELASTSEMTDAICESLVARRGEVPA